MADLIETYLNGPRTLSNARLSYLIVSEPTESAFPTPPRTPSPSREDAELTASAPIEQETGTQYELLICAMHFLGDGMALHQFANDFFGILGSQRSDAELQAMLNNEWRVRWATLNQQVKIDHMNASTGANEMCLGPHFQTDVLPTALEDNIPLPDIGFRRVAAKVDFALSQEKLLGGHAFPKKKHPERHTVVPTLSFSEERTKAMLKKCKANGVSISAVFFALCNVAWARMGGGSKEMPILMYSALNLRPYFTVRRPVPWDSYWFLAIGYFNVILPNFLPRQEEGAADASASVESTFWHRARQAKDQSTRAAKSPLIVSRTHEMARERGERARAWGKEDDEKENGTWVPPTAAPAPTPTADAAIPSEPVLPPRAKVPSTALLGLSLLGNLDGIYKHASFPDIDLHTLTTGSRQRHGAMLLFGYTFKGKLWISLGYDKNGFADGVVENFWKETLAGIDEFLG